MNSKLPSFMHMCSWLQCILQENTLGRNHEATALENPLLPS